MTAGKRGLTTLLLLVFSVNSLYSADSPEMKIGLNDKASAVTIAPGSYRLQSSRSRRVQWKNPVKIAVSHGKLAAGKETFGKKLVISSTETGVVKVNGRPYRGKITLVRNGSSVRVINEIPIEDYVRGVLLLETSDKWPPEALKAQAVISRTYALRNRGRHGRSGYDLCAEPHCQAYGGVSAERKATDAAVKATRGEAMVDRKKRLISTVFHSTCGGSTESAENVWEQGGQPYLQAVRCQWCKISPHYRWNARVPTGLVDERLARAGNKFGPVRAIGILSHTPSGRVYRVRVYGEHGTRDMNANTFRNIVDPRLIRSTYWSGVSKRDGAWQIHGRGWGHGVGLCQWGMKSLADNSMTYGQILRLYYHRVDIADWKE